MRSRDRMTFGLLILVAALTLHGSARVRDLPDKTYWKDQQGLDRVFVLDGSNVHNVGELHIHVSNWGMFGSMPGSTAPFSNTPSAEWPAGSGIDHLYVSGLWVGAKKNGIPAVSTSAYDMEFMPTDDPIDIIYRTAEGAQGGSRLPFHDADDDFDGLVDEDWLDGHDNDGDGLIDEDFAAISRQMFSCWFTDDQPAASELYTEHEPLHILVRQESYQWEDDRFDDFVGIKYTITNIGNDVLEDVYLGFFADGDVGPRNRPLYWEDDVAGSWIGPRCTDLGPVYLNMGLMSDADGDGGQTPSYIGVMLLGHTTDPLGLAAPRHVKIKTLALFSGELPYENGGDPTNDFQRYEILSRQRIDRDKEVPWDYRVLIGTGSFPELLPGNSLVIHIGLVAGAGITGVLDNAAYAQCLFDGMWLDIDNDPMTGIDRRETPVYGPAQDVVIDECRIPLSNPIDVPAGAVVWVNNDCSREIVFQGHCGYDPADSLVFCTGVAGRETQINWLIEMSAPEQNALDIRPGTCPNPFNVRLVSRSHWEKKKSQGVLPAAILGSESFDVHLVDISTIQLEGVPPLPRGQSYEDVSRPVVDRTGCECTSDGPDGYLDLKLRFSSLEIGKALKSQGAAVPGEERMLTLTGNLIDGTPFQVTDCVVFVGKHHWTRHEWHDPRLLAAYPNPFNPVTLLTYYLPERQYIRLSIYDAAGRFIDVLEEGFQSGGEHSVEWNASSLASGIYFYRLEAGGKRMTRKVVLIK